jgi:hypothetical protein
MTSNLSNFSARLSGFYFITCHSLPVVFCIQEEKNFCHQWSQTWLSKHHSYGNCDQRGFAIVIWRLEALSLSFTAILHMKMIWYWWLLYNLMMMMVIILFFASTFFSAFLYHFVLGRPIGFFLWLIGCLYGFPLYCVCTFYVFSYGFSFLLIFLLHYCVKSLLCFILYGYHCTCKWLTDTYQISLCCVFIRSFRCLLQYWIEMVNYTPE